MRPVVPVLLDINRLFALVRPCLPDVGTRRKTVHPANIGAGIRPKLPRHWPSSDVLFRRFVCVIYLFSHFIGSGPLCTP
uniref:Putative secreted protein n=1 Tax=Ixodes ricinus TaxID=34613 RepID=A0A6B0TX38_IXORI